MTVKISVRVFIVFEYGVGSEPYAQFAVEFFVVMREHYRGVNFAVSKLWEHLNR